MGGLGGLAVGTELSGAVVATGAVVVDSHVKKVQHPTGGVIGEINVRDGSRVKAGDLLVRLDETVARASLAMITKSLDELAARKVRLEAERDGSAAISFPAVLTNRIDEPELAALIDGESKLFRSRCESRAGQKSQLLERIVQLQEQIKGTELQAAAKTDEITLITSELAGVQELYRKNLVPITRVTQLRREETRLRGEQGSLIASVAQARGRISETELQILQIDQDLRSEAGKDISDVQAKAAELVERKIAAEDQLDRIDIRAPQDGIVHQLAVHTVGGVVAAGELLMLVVPEADNLSIEVKVGLQDIDQITFGQSTLLRMTAFNQRTTPEIRGYVKLVPADLITDQRSGLQYYPVQVGLDPAEREKPNGLKLVPGMPVEAFIQTGYRTIFSYLTKPLADQMFKAFRHD
jgi:HlyD family secretion protein